MKRNIVSVLAISIFIILLTGCRSSENNSNLNPQDAENNFQYDIAEINSVNLYINTEIEKINVKIVALDEHYDPILVEIAQQSNSESLVGRYLGTKDEYDAKIKEYSSQLQSSSITHQSKLKYLASKSLAEGWSTGYYNSQVAAENQRYNSEIKPIQAAKSALETAWEKQLIYLEIQNSFFEVYYEYQDLLNECAVQKNYYENLRTEMIEAVYKKYGITPR